MRHHISSLLKKSILAFFTVAAGKRGFPVARIFNDLSIIENGDTSLYRAQAVETLRFSNGLLVVIPRR